MSKPSIIFVTAGEYKNLAALIRKYVKNAFIVGFNSNYKRAEYRVPEELFYAMQRNDRQHAYGELYDKMAANESISLKDIGIMIFGLEHVRDIAAGYKIESGPHCILTLNYRSFKLYWLALHGIYDDDSVLAVDPNQGEVLSESDERIREKWAQWELKSDAIWKALESEFEALHRRMLLLERMQVKTAWDEVSSDLEDIQHVMRRFCEQRNKADKFEEAAHRLQALAQAIRSLPELNPADNQE